MKRVKNITEIERGRAEWRERNAHVGCNVITKSKDGGTLNLATLD